MPASDMVDNQFMAAANIIHSAAHCLDFSLTSGLVILTLITVTFYCVYQVYLHPLANYPGPLSAKFTFLRATYHAWKGDIHLDMWYCHHKYGPIVRYGPDHILFNSVEGLKGAYGIKKNTWKHKNFEFLNPIASNLLTLVDKKEHSYRRRLVGQMFTRTNMENLQTKFMLHIRRFCKQVCQAPPPMNGRGWSPPMNMSDWCGYLVFDMNCDLIFSKEYNLLETEDHRNVPRDVQDAGLRSAVMVYFPWILIGRLDKKLFRNSAEASRRYWRFIKRTVTEREKATHSNDVFAHLSKKDNSGKGLAIPQILSEAGTLSLAGLDTTSTLMCSLMFYLARNRHAYDVLAHEIRGAFNSIDEICLNRLNDCVYLQACIDEALRICPPISNCPWRQVGEGGETIDGHFIPAGYNVGTGMYAIHHHEGYYPHPHEFIPERWLKSPDAEASDAELEIAKAAFSPFSMGSRQCVAINVVHAQVRLTLATVIWMYDFRLPWGQEGQLGTGNPFGERFRTSSAEYQILDRVIGVKDGPMIQFRPCKDACAVLS